MNGTVGVRGVGEVGFADVVLADQGWLDAEFDAIVAANFGAVDEPRSWSTAPGPSGGSHDPDRSAGPNTLHVVRLAHRVDPCERSPPPCGVDGWLFGSTRR